MTTPHRHTVRTKVFLLVGLLVLGIASPAQARDKPKPNVLFIAIDDLRPELGCYGARHIHSPHIDRLAQRGVLFNRAYCQCPVCGPSRASLLLGVYPRGIQKQSWSAEEMRPGTVTLPQAFRQAGYHTVSNGKIFHDFQDTASRSWSEPPFSLVNGKDFNHLTHLDPASKQFILRKNNRGPFYEAPDVPDDAYIDGRTCQKAIRDMRRLAKMNKPFFLACGFVRPHLPFYAPKKYWDRYDRETIQVADNPYRPKNAPASLRGSREFGSYHDRDIKYNSPQFHKIARHGYYACVSYVDGLVGKLLAELDELELRDKTIVVLWGDHGWNLGEHAFWSKHNTLHNSTRVPLIISAPGCAKSARAEGMVGLVDLYPTLCELAGIKPPSHLEGASVAPLLKDPKQPGKPAEFTRWNHCHTITTPDHAFTQWDNPPQHRMLFDHEKDPDENVNVSELPGYQATVKKLNRLLIDQASRIDKSHGGKSAHVNIESD